MSEPRQFVPGVYRLLDRGGDAGAPVVYFDGERFWLPGWECPMKPANWNGSFALDVADVGDLLWEDVERQPKP